MKSNSPDVLLVAEDSHLYFFDFLTDIDVIAYKDLDSFSVDEDKPNMLSNYRLIIFLDSGFKDHYPKIIKEFTTAKLILFFWNHFTLKEIDLLRVSKSNGIIDSYYSFDPGDANKYGIYHNSTLHVNLCFPSSPLIMTCFSEVMTMDD